MTDSLRDALEKLCDRYDRIAEEVSVRGGVKATYDIPGSEIRHLLAAHPAEPVGVSDETSLGLTRPEIRAEVDELIRNAYAEGWREAKQRPDAEPPLLDIIWTGGRGVLVTEMWCECEIDPDRRLLLGPHHEPSCLRYVNGPARPPEAIQALLRGDCACTPAERHLKHNYPGEYMGGGPVVADRGALRAEVIRVIDRSMDTGALNPDDVVDAVEPFLQPQVVASQLIAEPDGENALAPWLEEVFSTDEETVTWEQAANALFDLGAVREAQPVDREALERALLAVSLIDKPPAQIGKDLADAVLALMGGAGT